MENTVPCSLSDFFHHILHSAKSRRCWSASIQRYWPRHGLCACFLPSFSHLLLLLLMYYYYLLWSLAGFELWLPSARFKGVCHHAQPGTELSWFGLLSSLCSISDPPHIQGLTKNLCSNIMSLSLKPKSLLLADSVHVTFDKHWEPCLTLIFSTLL